MLEMTISDVSRVYDVSTRMLRHYEKIGLLQSGHKADYAYRVYDEEAIKRLQCIILFRKLRIPLKHIAVILADDSQMKSLEILKMNLSEIDGEITALSTIRDFLNAFVAKLDESIRSLVKLDLLKEQTLIDLSAALRLSKSTLKTSVQEELVMDKLNNANKTMDGHMDIRILYLPPATVVSSHYIGENPEDISGERLKTFIKESNLPQIKPDFRVYGFNNPSPQEGQPHYGYEFWATIPKNLAVDSPLEKKQFSGGLYAAHCIKMGDFQEWQSFYEQISRHEEYDVDWTREPQGMQGCLEEHLNAHTYYTVENAHFVQLDLLIPIKRK